MERRWPLSYYEEKEHVLIAQVIDTETVPILSGP